MLLVDSSVWIDYFNGIESPQTDILDRVLGEQIVLVGDIILAEVLQGFRRKQDFDRALAQLSHFRQISLIDPILAVQSARHFRRLRARGFIVRKTIDCLIATFCIETGVSLLHTDRDYQPFVDVLGLKLAV